ncbi:MAG: arginine--tRNA ligase [Anaerolineales bacterium]
MFDNQLEHAANLILQQAADMGLPQPDRIEWNPTPFRGEWGFGTAACFKIAAAEARSGKSINIPQRANELAQEIVAAATPFPDFSHAEAENGYINLYLDPPTYARTVIDTALQQGQSFGKGSPKPERVMVEYAQPNTHHSFHIGHARNAILGEALARITEFAGFETIRASYPGDVGLGVIKCLWIYDKFYKGQEPEGIHARGQWLAKLYTEANQILAADPEETEQEAAQREEYNEEVRQLYKAWDQGDPEIVKLWERTRAWSLEELNAILELLNVDIDVFFYESEVDEPAKEIVEELIELGIAEDERSEGGPVIVKIDEQLGLEKEKYRTAVLLRSDGTTLYLAKDLALAKQKFEEYQVERSIYVVDVRQSLHLQQAFKILELWGFPQAEKCYHLAYGFVSLPEGAMSSRAGNVVLFMDVVEESRKRVNQIILEKNPDLAEAERLEVSNQVAMGSLAYAMLAVDNVRDTVFDWDRALDFEGQAAPYIQYAHVRATSILKRQETMPGPLSPDYELEEPEIALLDRISRFPDEVQRGAKEYKPLVIANYAYELAKDFTNFYQQCPVLSAEPPIRDVRLRLTEAARQTLENSLRLLTVPSPDVM